ncbi:MAG: hypothetical protein ABSA16_10840 [Thermoguttaceae bacterium]|jgi:hypothetical protein
MKSIYERLYIGTEEDCRSGNNEWAIVHACKSPCHQREVGYHGSLPSTHPNYLVLERENDLILNMVDPPRPLFMPKLFIDFLWFSEKHWNKGKNLLIHCNLGESRAPSLALLFIAKRLHRINGSSYENAKSEFMNLFPSYTPGLGIQIYLHQHWNEF